MKYSTISAICIATAVIGLILCLLFTGCASVSWDAFIKRERTACMDQCHAQNRGWRIECYGRRCSCICPPRDEP